MNSAGLCWAQLASAPDTMDSGCLEYFFHFAIAEAQKY